MWDTGLDLGGEEAGKPWNYPQDHACVHPCRSCCSWGWRVGKGDGKVLWLSLDSRRPSALWSKPAPSESRRLAWQLPVVSHLPNGSSKQMFHFLFRGQTYWTGSFNLKTQQHYPNLWKTCQVRKIAFIRNQLILCIYNLLFWIFQFRTRLKENRKSPHCEK